MAPTTLSAFAALAALLAALPSPADAIPRGQKGLGKKPHTSIISSCSTHYEAFPTNYVPTSWECKTVTTQPHVTVQSTKRRTITATGTGKRTVTITGGLGLKTKTITRTRTSLSTGAIKIASGQGVTLTALTTQSFMATGVTTTTITNPGATVTVTLPTTTITSNNPNFVYPSPDPPPRIRKRKPTKRQYPNKVYCTYDKEVFKPANTMSGDPIVKKFTSMLAFPTGRGKVTTISKSAGKGKTVTLTTTLKRVSTVSGKGLAVVTTSTINVSGTVNAGTQTVSNTLTVTVQPAATVTVQPTAVVSDVCGSANLVSTDSSGNPLSFNGSLQPADQTVSTSSAADCCKLCQSTSGCTGSRYNVASNNCFIYSANSCPADQSNLVGQYAWFGGAGSPQDVFSDGPCGHWQYGGD